MIGIIHCGFHLRSVLGFVNCIRFIEPNFLYQLKQTIKNEYKRNFNQLNNINRYENKISNRGLCTG